MRGVCFYAATAVVAIFLFQLMIVAHPFVLLFDRYQRKAHHFIAKLWSMWSVAPFYRIEINGLENLPPPDTPAVYVSNHQSFLDIYTLLTLGRSFKFISKTEIFLFPIIGWAMYMLGTIPLKRMDSRSQLVYSSSPSMNCCQYWNVFFYHYVKLNKTLLEQHDYQFYGYNSICISAHIASPLLLEIISIDGHMYISS